MAVPSIITSLALPPGVQQTANDVVCKERKRKAVAGEPQGNSMGVSAICSAISAVTT